MDRDPAASPIDAASKATRLLCAGVYLDGQFADAVVTELVTNRHRTVAPSYGYDAIPVVAHALAVRMLRNQRNVVNTLGVVAFFAMAGFGWIGPLSAWMLVLWLLWATTFLRRLAMLDALVNRLKRPQRLDAAVRVYPHTAELVPALVDKISDEQSAAGNSVHYAGYYPFVGAGVRVSSWTAAVLLDGAPIQKVFDDESGVWDARDETPARGPKREEVTPFTVEDLAEHVRGQLTRQLRENPSPDERIKQLTIERRLYGKARPGRLTALPSPDGASTETYAASRSYLCIRVGSWDQELVTSMFVGFDIKGDTLYSEFHVHVLPPVTAAFHAIDRLPARLDGALIGKVAADVFKDGVGAVFGVFTKTGRGRVRQRVREGNVLKFALAPTGGGGDDDGLTRYAARAVDRGALLSIREMAASEEYHHYFQEADADKYTKIVERRLLDAIRGFLKEHHVDLQDYDARQTNILNRYGDIVNNGDGNVSVANRGVQSVGHGSSAQSGEKPK